MAARDEAAVDVDVPAVVVAAAVVEVPPRSCVEMFTVLPPEDTSRFAIWKNARTVQERDRQIAKEKAKRLIVKGKIAKANADTTLANATTKKAKDQLCAVKASRKLAAESADKGKKKLRMRRPLEFPLREDQNCTLNAPPTQTITRGWTRRSVSTFWDCSSKHQNQNRRGRKHLGRRSGKQLPISLNQNRRR